MEYGPCEGDHAEEEILKMSCKDQLKAYSNKLKSLVGAKTIPRPRIGKVNGNEVKENFTISPTRLTGFSEKVHIGHNKKATKLLTFTAARMLYGKVQSIETNFLFKQTFVVVCCAIG